MERPKNRSKCALATRSGKNQTMSETRLSESFIAEIAQLLKAAREEKREELAELAYRIALSPSQLRALESGNTGPFYSHAYFLQAAQRYADAFGIRLPLDVQANAAFPSPLASAPSASTPLRPAPAVTSEPLVTPQAKEPMPVIHTPVSKSPPPRLLLNAESGIGPAEGSSDHRMRWAWVGVACLFAILLGVTKIITDENASQGDTTALATPSSLTQNTAPVEPPAPTQAVTPAAQAASTAPAPPAPIASAPTPPATASRSSAQDVPLSLPPVAGASLPNSKSNPTSNQRATTAALGSAKSYLISEASTWVQVVRSTGEKINVRIQPGERVEFDAEETAAIVFGRPSEATLFVRGGRVNLDPFIVGEEKRRALVIMSQLKPR
jgi:cytoskeletal protein RodZ